MRTSTAVAVWVGKYAGGGLLSYIAPRFLVAIGVPLDRWVAALASWAIHLDREAALWTASFGFAFLLYAGSVYLSKDRDWRPEIPGAIKRLGARVEPIHLIVLGLVIALGGAIWMWRVTPSIAAQQSEIQKIKSERVGAAPSELVTAPPLAPPASLKDAIDAFLAKSGKKANYHHSTNRTVGMADASDGRGPFIDNWDASLDPWPTIADGFTAHQLRIFPKRKPGLTLQGDKENFGKAVDRLYNLLVQQPEQMIVESETVISQLNRPVGDMINSQLVLGHLTAIDTTRRSLEVLLFNDQQGFFREYPRYREELKGILPDDSRQLLESLGPKLADLIEGTTLLDEAKKAGNGQFVVRAGTILNSLNKAYIERIQALRDWVRICNMRLSAMTRAI